MKTNSPNEVQKMKKINLFAVLTAIASLAAVPAASAQEVTCESANFTPAVLEAHGSVRFSCLEIVERNGKPHAVLNAEVVRASPPNLTVKFKRNDDSMSNPVTLTPEMGYDFTLDGGKKLALRELTSTTILRIYVPVTAPVA